MATSPQWPSDYYWAMMETKNKGAERLDQPAKRPKVAPAGEDTKEKKGAEEPIRKREELSAKEGFVLQCQDGATVAVSPSEAKVLKEKCEFFRNAFRPGTKEYEVGILSKPDWTKDTADGIVDLITRGRCEIPQDYKLLKAAATQILIPLRVIHPLDGRDISNDEETVQSLFKQWTSRKSHFVFDIDTSLLPSSDPARWSDLFKSGIVLIRDEKDMIVELGTTTNSRISPKETTFQVAAATPLCVAVFHTCLYLSRSTASDKGNGNAMKRLFQIQFKANLGSGLYLKHALGKNVCYHDLVVHEMVNFTGTVEELLRSLDVVEDFIIPQKNTKLCFLQAINPNSWTLGRLISASQRCVDNPATLGATLNSFCALKSTQDIQIMLSHLLDPSMKAAATGPFHLKDLSLLRDCWEAF